MKKRLSIVLAIAMVFSMFSSLAFAAEKSSMDKFEALKSQGIFTGYPDGSAGLDKEMNRAEFAAVIARALGLEATEGNSYSDVDANDIEKYDWAAGYIEAVTEAGILEGDGNGKFAPGRDVSIQELLVIVARVLDLDVSDETEVENAYDWAYGAINATNALNVLPEQEDYLAAASREQLVIATYAAVEELTSRAQQLSIADAKATDASEVTVSLNKASSKDEIVVTLKKGSITTAVEKTVWSEDNKTVTLTTNSKLTEGTYTVSIEAASGKEIEIGTDSKSFDVTNERVTKVEFVAASDEIALFNKNVVQFRALNQYDKVSSFSANSFTITSNLNNAIQKDSSKQEFTLDTTGTVTGARVSVTIIAPNGEATANKLFTVGLAPAAAKIEFGEIELDQDKEILIAGDSAVLPITVYDQYGNILRDDQAIDNSTTKISTRTDVIDSVTVNPDGNLDLTTLGTALQDTDVTINIIAHADGSSYTKVVKVYAKKSPAEIEFVAKDEVIAVGDDEKYIELKITDQFGKVFTKDEIVAASKDNKFTIYSTNSSVLTIPNQPVNDTNYPNLTSVAGIVQSGPERGKLEIQPGIASGNAEIKIMVNNGAKTFSHGVTVQEKRVPNSVVVKKEGAEKLLPSASSKVTFVVRDQYGANLAANNADISGYQVEFETNNNNVTTAYPTGTVAGTPTYLAAIASDIEVTLGHGANGKTELTVKLVKTGTNGSTVSTVKRTYEAVASSAASGLTYEVTEVGTIFGIAGNNENGSEAKEIKITAKDSSGKTVALVGGGNIGEVTSSDDTILDVGTVNKSKVFGLKKGTVTVTVKFTPVPGETRFASQTVEVSTDAVVAESLTVKNASANVTETIVSPATFATVAITDITGDVVMKSNYGTEYKNADFFNGGNYTKANIAISNVKGTGSVVINGTNLEIDAGVTSFTITIVSATNGKSVKTDVTSAINVQ